MTHRQIGLVLQNQQRGHVWTAPHGSDSDLSRSLRHDRFLCCKTLLSISARNIDSRSGANTQQRFKRTGAPILLFQISISQSLLGDFCNTIGQDRTSADVCDTTASPPEADVTRSPGDVAEG